MISPIDRFHPSPAPHFSPVKYALNNTSFHRRRTTDKSWLMCFDHMLQQLYACVRGTYASCDLCLYICIKVKRCLAASSSEPEQGVFQSSRNKTEFKLTRHTNDSVITHQTPVKRLATFIDRQHRAKDAWIAAIDHFILSIHCIISRRCLLFLTQNHI